MVTQERHVKASGRWYAATMAANAVADPCPFLQPATRADPALGCGGSCASGVLDAAAASAHVTAVLFIAIVGLVAAVGVAGVAFRRRQLAQESRDAEGPSERMVEAVEPHDDGL